MLVLSFITGFVLAAYLGHRKEAVEKNELLSRIKEMHNLIWDSASFIKDSDGKSKDKWTEFHKLNTEIMNLLK